MKMGALPKESITDPKFWEKWMKTAKIMSKNSRAKPIVR